MSINKLNLDNLQSDSWLEDIWYKISESKAGRWFYWNVEDKYLYKIRKFFNPCHKLVRNSIPRTWSDLTELIVDINFAIIRDFFENEYNQNTVDWVGSSKEHAEFEQWLRAAYYYITVERPQLEKELSDSFEKVDVNLPLDKWVENMNNDKRTYEEKYGETDRIEAEIDKRDTQVIVQMVTYRAFFWT